MHVRKSILKILLAVVLIAAAAVTTLAAAYPKYTVTVWADGRDHTVTTHSRDAASVVAQAGVKVGKDDYIDQSHFRAGREKEDGNALRVLRAFPVKVHVDGGTKTGMIAHGTIADAVEKAGVVLGKDDLVSPSKKAAVKPGTDVDVTRIRYENRVEEKAIPYRTVKRDTAALKPGQQPLAQKGRNGKRAITFQEKYVDGVLTDTQKISDEVLAKPIFEVIAIGRQFIQNLNIHSAPGMAQAVITGKATAYTAKPGALTASGLPAGVGRVAVDPKQIPYGTEMFVVAQDGEVYGFAIAADTGGFVGTTDVTMDLYMNTEEECRQWGKKDVNIYILKWGTGHIG